MISDTSVKILDKLAQCDIFEEVKSYENDLDVGHVLIGHMGLSYIMRMG